MNKNSIKEIGGFLGLEDFKGNEYHNSLYRFNTARNAIKYVIIHKQYKKVYVPFYLCDCITDMLENSNIDYDYYNIDINLNPIIDFEIKENEVMLLVNYFGKYDNEEIIDYSKKYNIIVDNTQAFFNKPIQRIDIVYNCRKFFGVSDGAYLNTDIENLYYEKLQYDISNKRMAHVLGRYEESAHKHYSEFKNNDESLADLPIMKMSKLTENLMRVVDYSNAMKKRKENYNYLSIHLDKINMLKVINHNNLFMYPLYIKDGQTIRKELIKKNIYIPILWPNVIETMPQDTVEYKLAYNTVLLPIDHRYGKEEMDIMIENIYNYRGVN